MSHVGTFNIRSVPEMAAYPLACEPRAHCRGRLLPEPRILASASAIASISDRPACGSPETNGIKTSVDSPLTAAGSRSYRNRATTSEPL